MRGARRINVADGQVTPVESDDSLSRALFCDAHREFSCLLARIEACTIADDATPAQLRLLRSLLLKTGKCLAMQSELHAGLCSLALTDDLTELYNHRGFLLLGTQLLNVASRSRRDVLLFFADVDQLKSVNDQFGHAAGDACLVGFADALRHTFRRSDIAARYGGDEFVVLAWESRDDDERAILTRLRSAIEQLNNVKRGFGLSVSIGAARFDHRSPTSLAELLVHADSQMYQHKRADHGISMPGR